MRKSRNKKIVIRKYADEKMNKRENEKILK